ncbi:MAG: GNAT family N-acetyltransferase [Pseudonocardiaceae bacterium]
MPDPQNEPWPLRHLVLRTPRLTLRPDDDAGLYELAALALRGIHPPEQMPFLQPWTDQAPDDLARSSVQYYWRARAQLTATGWSVNFLVRHGGRVIGVQGLSGEQFAITREVSTGSWLGLSHQRQGFGTEMRAAVLLLAFDHFGATIARSGAFADNAASLRLSAKLGYRTDGTHTVARRGTAATEVRLVLEPSRFVRPDWTLQEDGLDDCRELLGAI